MTVALSRIDPLAQFLSGSELEEMFPVTRNLVYLQNASIGPLPRPVLEAATDMLISQSRFGTEHYVSWLARNEEVRSSVARLLNADKDEVSFIRNTAEGLARIAFGMKWKSGDNIVSFAHEYPTNVLPWLALQEQGVETRLVPVTDGRIDVDTIAPLVDSRTRLIALSSIQFATGFRLDLEEIGQFCRERGVLLSIDAIQHLGVVPFDVKETPVDFISAGAHKWLLSPSGSGVFYIRRELLNQLDVVEVGFAGTAAYNLNDELLGYSLKYRDSAQRFEGGLTAFSALSGFGAAADMFNSIGIDNIYRHVLALTDLADNGLRELGFEVVSPRVTTDEKSGIFTFYHTKHDSAQIKQFLLERGISLSVRTVLERPMMRISPHVYNTREDIEQLLAALAELPTVI
mgnify:CR=1 FL=1